jgi:hypothetical protein
MLPEINLLEYGSTIIVGNIEIVKLAFEFYDSNSVQKS